MDKGKQKLRLRIQTLPMPLPSCFRHLEDKSSEILVRIWIASAMGAAKEVKPTDCKSITMLDPLRKTILQRYLKKDADIMWQPNPPVSQWNCEERK